ncbi:MAG: hypothetical protein EOP48_28435 [Sphingobacteriales bacterium]|nr:MAG: hypothetical protein EOP48_28435 [Sphingobacteriales bacterium]
MDKSKELIESYFREAQRLHYYKRDFEAANRYYLKVIRLEPNHINAINGLAQNLRLNIKDYPAAINAYSKVIELDKRFEHAIFRRGICYGCVGNFQAQFDDYSFHIQYIKSNGEEYISRALISQKLGRFDNVLSDCWIAIFIKGVNDKYLIKSLNEAYGKYGYN